MVRDPREELHAELPRARIPAGGLLALGQVAKVKLVEQPVQFVREDTQRRVSVLINVRGRDTASFDLHGKTVGIVGTGRIGRITAQIFRGFGAEVIAHDPFPTLDWAAARGIRYVDFDALLAASDIISLHVPLLPETRHLLNPQTIAQTKPGVFIVNTSRGKLIDTGALIAALKAGRIGGVALDVYEEEEGIFFEDLSGQMLHDDELSLLLNFPNVLITAHQAFLTREALSEIARVTTENLIHLEAGEPFLDGTALCNLAPGA